MIRELVITGSFVCRVAHSDEFCDVRVREPAHVFQTVASVGPSSSNQLMIAQVLVPRGIRSSQADSLKPWVLTEADAEFVEHVLDPKETVGKLTFTPKKLPSADARALK
jgi:hypothetical protein